LWRDKPAKLINARQTRPLGVPVTRRKRGITMSIEELFESGLKTRREVLGAQYVDTSLAAADDFMMAFQHVTTEWAWGYTWNRPGLDRRTRSLLNLAMLTALGKPDELRLHVRGALTNGVTAEEIKEVLIHATAYCGIPAGLEAFKAAHAALIAEGALTEPELET
jgi:4-carboxymuconolactone decarboxylase